MVVNIVVEGAKFLGSTAMKKVVKNVAIEVAAGITAHATVHFGSKALIKVIEKKKKQKETENGNTELQEVGA